MDRTGHTVPTECPNCHREVELTVRRGKVRCPLCPLAEDAQGLRIEVVWDD